MSNPVVAALASAVLFGLSTPLAKILVEEVPPVALAGLLYLGSGIGLLLWRWGKQKNKAIRKAGKPRYSERTGAG